MKFSRRSHSKKYRKSLKNRKNIKTRKNKKKTNYKKSRKRYMGGSAIDSDLLNCNHLGTKLHYPDDRSYHCCRHGTHGEFLYKKSMLGSKCSGSQMSEWRGIPNGYLCLNEGCLKIRIPPINDELLLNFFLDELKKGGEIDGKAFLSRANRDEGTIKNMNEEEIKEEIKEEIRENGIVVINPKPKFWKDFHASPPGKYDKDNGILESVKKDEKHTPLFDSYIRECDLAKDIENCYIVMDDGKKKMLGENKLCNGKEYDIKKQGCCNTEIFDKKTKFCYNNKIIDKCDGNDDTTEPSFDPESQFCYENEIIDKCNEFYHNPKLQFCDFGKIIDKCDGKSFNPAKQFCYSSKLYDKCNGKDNKTTPSFNPVSQFCHSKEIFEKCDNQKYNPECQKCKNPKYNPECQKCKNQKYNPECQKCKKQEIKDKTSFFGKKIC